MKRLISYLVFGNGRQIEHKATFWNMMFSGVNALQSAIMLLMVTRVCGAEAGGILSIAIATAQLMYGIGTYSVRSFQATDTQRIYTYGDYHSTRIVTCAAMIVVSVGYCLRKGYEPLKMAVTLSMCILKVLEAMESVYHGELQREGRLDIAGRTGTSRTLLGNVAFFVVLLITRNVLWAVFAMILASLLTLIVSRRIYASVFRCEKGNSDWGAIGGLLAVCFPLFVSGLLSIYISNAAKYAIDANLGDVTQAYFSVIFMPVFTINLLSSMIYYPHIKCMAERWNDGDARGFKQMVLRHIFRLFAISTTILIFGILIGLKLLGIFYSLPISNLKTEFGLLLVGGGFAALYNFLSACITAVRQQGALLVISGGVALVALLLSGEIVVCMGLRGACWLYFLLMLLEAVFSTAFLIRCYKRVTRKTSSL